MEDFHDEDIYYLVRRHPLQGFTFVTGYVNNTDESGSEVVPVARDSDTMYDSIESARNSALKMSNHGSVYVHEECCSGHIYISINCLECGVEYLACMICEFKDTYGC